MTFTSILGFLFRPAAETLWNSRSRPDRVNQTRLSPWARSPALRCLPRLIDPLGCFDNPIVSRTPSESFARLLRRDELVLVKPGADVVALHRPLESNVTLVTRCIETGAHDVETARPAFIAEVKDLSFDDGFVRLDDKAVCFG